MKLGRYGAGVLLAGGLVAASCALPEFEKVQDSDFNDGGGGSSSGASGASGSGGGGNGGLSGGGGNGGLGGASGNSGSSGASGSAGVGGSAGTGGVPSTANRCPDDDIGVDCTEPPSGATHCCALGLCGLEKTAWNPPLMMGGSDTCQPVGLPGIEDPSCPQLPMGPLASNPGCCTFFGECGVSDPDFGCVPGPELGLPMQSCTAPTDCQVFCSERAKRNCTELTPGNCETECEARKTAACGPVEWNEYMMCITVGPSRATVCDRDGHLLYPDCVELHIDWLRDCSIPVPCEQYCYEVDFFCAGPDRQFGSIQDCLMGCPSISGPELQCRLDALDRLLTGALPNVECPLAGGPCSN